MDKRFDFVYSIKKNAYPIYTEGWFRAAVEKCVQASNRVAIRMILVDISIWIDHLRKNDERLARISKPSGTERPVLNNESRVVFEVGFIVRHQNDA